MPDDEEQTRAAYDVVADLYADTFTATEPEQELELAMVRHFATLVPEPRRVLDAGCGAGRMLPFLAGLGCRPEGLDLSPAMVRRARADHPEYPTTVGSLVRLDLADASVDGVFSWYSTIHNPDEDLDAMVGEMARVVRPGGPVLLAFQVGRGRHRVGRGYAARGYDVVLHRYHRTVPQVAAALRARGLVVVAELERAPVAGEADPQAVVVARRLTSHDAPRA